jgi:hypothetical protein
MGLLLVVLLLTADAIGVVVVTARHQDRAASVTAGVTPPTTAPPRSAATTTTAPPLASGQTVVTGTVSSISAAGATGPQLTTPLLITIPVRGQGSAYIYNADVSGHPGETIYWYGGQPLSILGSGGALIPGRINVTVDPSGSTWYLDGAERKWVPAAYQVDTPVAVGSTGLANAEPSADFTAGSTTVLASHGDATLHRPAMALHLTGPGAVQIQGRLKVRTRSGTTSASTLNLASGSDYVIDLTPVAGGGLAIQATLQGRTSSH